MSWSAAAELVAVLATVGVFGQRQQDAISFTEADAWLLGLACPVYRDEYQVYQLPDDPEDRLASSSWIDLCHLGRWIERLPASAVSFDDTLRRCVDPAFIDRVERPSPRDGLGGPC